MKHCIVSFEDREITDKLSSIGYICHNVIQSSRVSRPISDHSDVLYKKVNRHTIMASSCQKANFGLMERLGFTIEEIDDLHPGYRTECRLNFIINDKYIIRNPKTATDFPCTQTEIQVNQGYTGCSAICVADDAYITEDDGIYKKLTENGLDCLKIKKGNVRLDGYEYGFIGGASVKLNEKEILFFGEIMDNNDRNNVINFLEKYGMKAIFIENKQLHDIGSALIL